MKPLSLGVVGGAIVIAILVTSRWEIVSSPGNPSPYAFRLDRWTGQVTYCRTSSDAGTGYLLRCRTSFP